MKTLIAILTILIFTGNVFANDVDFKQGCQKFQNPESLLKRGWIVKDKHVRGLDIIGYCQGRSKLLTMKYGNAQSLMVNNRFGIGQNVTYSYQTFCNTLAELHWRLAGDRQEIQKLIILILSPILVDNENSLNAPMLRVLPEVINMMFPEDIDPLNLFQIDIDLFEKRGLKDINKTNKYKAFYAALFIGDTEGALQLVRSMPDGLIPIINNFCQKKDK